MHYMHIFHGPYTFAFHWIFLFSSSLVLSMAAVVKSSVHVKVVRWASMREVFKRRAAELLWVIFAAVIGDYGAFGLGLLLLGFGSLTSVAFSAFVVR
jgi:hypothetical protein